ncbi:peptide/nickel transport system substrate-binding protein [Stackebrandtia albiflava]|uniref:Peptide/nickel transport system substrate-binding protein n=1 Tax=Stackebrandtia albiflava TaxID=406432 RepID=A0A562VD67_9ACTN|nr:ABC transporter substrate-binding protein [Stackebrandtia albiflava]TWJ15798.1 peptide/nickel transport system substrate-binding protein [Stackebrandtia albiflava]
MRGISTRRRRGRTTRAAAAALLVVTLSTACTSEEPAPSGVGDEPGVGGTVKILTQVGGFESLDPQRIYVTDVMNVSKLITRTLTSFKAAPGAEGAELVGDLATDTGRPNRDNSVWEFTLREGVKWETGETVTCQDVRYGVLRNFDVRNEDAQITGGPPWPVAWLDAPEDYAGPRTDGDVDIPGVTCVDERTIRFKLKQPTANFPSAVAMTAFSPVPASADTWGDYRPVATGPYKLTEYREAVEGEPGIAVFERNDQWDAETDPVREAKPDRVEFALGIDREYAAQQIIAENPDYANAVMYENVPANYVQQVVNDAQLMSQTVNGQTSAISYLALNTETITQPECRQALVYGFNKRKYQDVHGGEIFGDYAYTMIPPDDPGHKDFDVYGLKNSPEGDLTKAQELLDGADCPTTLTLDAADTPTGNRTAQTIVDTYSRLGITVRLNMISPNNFFDELNFAENQHDMVLAGWVPDWPGGSGTLPALFHGDLLIEGANSNYARLDDPDINAMIDAASAEADLTESYRMWGEVDQAIQELAVNIPIAYIKVISLCGANVRGGFLNAQWGSVDISSLGVAADTE